MVWAATGLLDHEALRESKGLWKCEIGLMREEAAYHIGLPPGLGKT